MKDDLKFRTIKVSQKGQISIPSDIRRELKIKRGDELLLVKRGKKLLLEKTQQFEKEVKDEFEDLLSVTEYSLKKLWNNKEDEIWNEYLKRGKK